MRFPPISNRKDVASFSNRIRLLDIAIKQTALDQTLVAHPKDKFALILVGDLTQFIDANAGISRSLLQAQIALFPNRDFLHRQFTLHAKIARQGEAATKSGNGLPKTSKHTRSDG